MQLAQANFARFREGMQSALTQEFVALVDPVDRIADASPGFIWRLPAADGHVLSTPAGGDDRDVVNLSVWESYEHLHAFVYRSAHGGYVRRRARWFEPTGGPSTVLWWVRAGERPTVEEALRRLAHLRAHGPTRQAFTVRRRFGPSGIPVSKRRS